MISRRQQVGLWIVLLRLLPVFYLRKSQATSSDVVYKNARLASAFASPLHFLKVDTKTSKKQGPGLRNLAVDPDPHSLDVNQVYTDQVNKTERFEDHVETSTVTALTTGRMTNETTVNVNLTNFCSKYPCEKWKSLGLFDETYLERINGFWLTFEPASPASHHTLAILYIIIMTVGCSGNLLVILMFIGCRSLRTPANYLILNLAISDFGMLVKMPVFIINSFYEGPALGTVGCQIYGFIGGLTGTCSIMTLTAIAVDRYYVIVYPLSPYKRTTHARAILMIVAVWFYSGFFSSIPLTGINEYVSEGYLTSCSFDYLRSDTKSRVFIFIFFLAAWLLPLSLIVFSYIAIFRMVVQAEKMDFFNGANSRESFKYKRIKDKLRKEVKIAMLTTFIVLIWVFAWTPYAVVALLGIFGQEHLLTPLVSTLPALFCKLSSCINPFVYSISHPRFQKELRLKLVRLCRCSRTVTMLRKCSAPSISFDVSASEGNSELNTQGSESDADGKATGAGEDGLNMTVVHPREIEGSRKAATQSVRRDTVSKLLRSNQVKEDSCGETNGREGIFPSDEAQTFNGGKGRNGTEPSTGPRAYYYKTNRGCKRRTRSESDVLCSTSITTGSTSRGVRGRSRSISCPIKVAWLHDL